MMNVTRDIVPIALALLIVLLIPNSSGIALGTLIGIVCAIILHSTKG